MSFIEFILIAVISSVFAYTFLFIRYQMPAWKRSRIAASLAILANCLAKLDKDHLLNGKIRNGDYLHDKFYKHIFEVLRYKINLHPSMLDRLEYNEEMEEESRRLNREMDLLDNEAKAYIQTAMLHLGWILFLRNPVITIRAYLRVHKIKQDYTNIKNKNILKNKVTLTAKYITLRAHAQDYDLVPCRI